MGTLETLYFPDTVIKTDSQSPLFLFFDLVHLLQPVEADHDHNPATGFSDTFMDQGFCQVHTPAPLGNDRNRFLHLVNDIQTRKDDYAAQLSSLAIASMSTQHRNNESSKSAILSELLGGSRDLDAKEKEEARQAELWQARLVLAIAEILDHEEEEIADALSTLDKTKTELFDRLLGKDEEFEDDAPFSDLTVLQEKAYVPRPGMVKNRLKAWFSLYRAGSLPGWWLWATTRPEAAEIVLEIYEKKTGRTAIPLFHTELPAATGIELQDHMEMITAFKKEAEPLTGRIAQEFNTLVRQESTFESEPAGVLPEYGAWGEQWTDLLEKHFPAELYGRTPFCFHLLGNLSFSNLADVPNQNTETGAGVKHGILAVIG
jgi:hypothetical protein